MNENKQVYKYININTKTTIGTVKDRQPDRHRHRQADRDIDR